MFISDYTNQFTLQTRKELLIFLDSDANSPYYCYSAINYTCDCN
jgi:hypothetical protein